MRYVITALDILSLWVAGILVESLIAGALKFPSYQSVMNAATILALFGVNAICLRK